MSRGLGLALFVLVILDTGIVQEGPREGKPWILWYDTETARQWVEEDPTIYRREPTSWVRTWTPEDGEARGE